MARKKKKILGVTDENSYIHVRFHNPSTFTTCRTPAWATKVAGNVSKGAKTRQCRTPKGDWKTQSVLIKKRSGMTKAKARRAARHIYEMLES